MILESGDHFGKRINPFFKCKTIAKGDIRLKSRSGGRVLETFLEIKTNKFVHFIYVLTFSTIDLGLGIFL